MFAFAVFLSKGKDGDEQPQLTVDIGEPHTEALEETVDKGVDLVYSLNDRPPWYLCILLGFQVNICFFWSCTKHSLKLHYVIICLLGGRMRWNYFLVKLLWLAKNCTLYTFSRCKTTLAFIQSKKDGLAVSRHCHGCTAMAVYLFLVWLFFLLYQPDFGMNYI